MLFQNYIIIRFCCGIDQV